MNNRTIVVVNAGMPVLMPWAEAVAAVGYAWLPGQVMGAALADVLLGQAEPGGRLPVTVPAAEADCPVLHSVPEQGRLEVRLTMPARAFARYDEAAGVWVPPSGEFTIRIGRSSADLPLHLRVKSF